MKTRYGRPVYDENPFIIELKNKLIIKNDVKIDDLVLSDNEGNEITGTIRSTNKVIGLNYLQVTDDWINCMLDFTSNGNVAAWVTVLFMYEINHKAINKDYVFLPYERIVEISNTFNKPKPSKATVSRGCNKMYEKSVIANHYYGTSWYWFNPSMMFNGSISKILRD